MISIKQLAVLAAGLSFCMTMSGQELSKSMTDAVTTCESLASAIGSSGNDQLKASNKLLKNADIVNFNDLALVKGQEADLNGHFLFDEEFIDSLIVNRQVRSFATRFAHKRARRGSTGVNGRIRLTTRAIKAGETAVWKTVNRGEAEFAVVSEPGGLLTMTIRDTKGNVLYAETEDNKKGKPVRKARVILPEDKRTLILIEITNHSDKDVSFALLKN